MISVLSTSERNLGRLAEFRGEELWLRGWRSFSLTNVAAIIIPLALGVLALFLGGWWRLLSVALIAFVIYGCWAIVRGATTRIRLLDDGVLIDGEIFLSTAIARFEGRRVQEASGMDDNESGAQLWRVMTDGYEIPVIQMSGYARIEAIAAYLNDKLQPKR